MLHRILPFLQSCEHDDKNYRSCQNIHLERTQSLKIIMPAHIDVQADFGNQPGILRKIGNSWHWPKYIYIFQDSIKEDSTHILIFPFLSIEIPSKIIGPDNPTKPVPRKMSGRTTDKLSGPTECRAAQPTNCRDRQNNGLHDPTKYRARQPLKTCTCIWI